MYEGHGTYVYKNGDFYYGEFKNGLMEGVGVFNYKNGDIMEAEYKEGEVYGYYTLDRKDYKRKGYMNMTESNGIRVDEYKNSKAKDTELGLNNLLKRIIIRKNQNQN